MAGKKNKAFQKAFGSSKSAKGLLHSIASTAEELEESFDCLTCANCCKTLGPRLTRADISRAAGYLGISDMKFEETYLKVDEDGDKVMNSLPCPFLQEDNLCSIYPSRPKACREYPHVDLISDQSKKKLTLTNCEHCPIIGEAFKEHLGG